MPGTIKEIYIAERGNSPVLLASVQVEEGKGVAGDRYFEEKGTFSKKLEGNRKSEITFIAAEEIDKFNETQNENIGYGDARRNIITLGIELHELIGKEFSIGTARFLGIERCEPCAHLAKVVSQKVLPHLVNTGLRAAILKSGEISIGCEVVS